MNENADLSRPYVVTIDFVAIAQIVNGDIILSIESLADNPNACLLQVNQIC